MKIQCKLKREGGTRAEIGGIEYFFEPLADGTFVCEVEDEAHIDRFLSISEAYKVYLGSGKTKFKPQKVSESVALPALKAEDTKELAPLSGSDLLPPQFEVGDRVVTQLEAVKIAFAASGLTSDEWNDLGDEERAARMEVALDEIVETEETNAEIDAADVATLTALYKQRFGKAPHHMWSTETLVSKLKAQGE